MAYANLPPNLQEMFNSLTDRLTKLENAQRFTLPNTPPVVTQPSITGLSTDDPTYPRTGDAWLNSTANLVRYVDKTGAVQQLTAQSSSCAVSGNYVINGGMDFDQRGQSPLGGYFSGYSLDRWYWITGAPAVKILRSAATAPTGFYYSAAMSAADNRVTPGVLWGQLVQAIETNNVQFIAGQTVTLSAYLQANTLPSQTVTMSIYTSTNVDDTPLNVLGYSPLASVTVVAPSGSFNGFIRQTLTATIPANAGTVFVSFTSARTNDTNYGPGTNQLYVSGVQLEVGSTVSGFSRAGQTYGGELLLCQRYYQQWNDANGGVICNGTMYGSANQQFFGVLSFQAPMRIAPTMSVTDATQVLVYTQGTGVACNGTYAFAIASPYSVRLNFTRTTAVTVNSGAWLQWNTLGSGNYIDASAEL